MFWNKFEFLCKQKGKSPNAIVEEIGLSSGICTKWKNGAIPKGEILLKIAEYFDCSVDYLVDRTDNPQFEKSVFNPETLNFMKMFENLPQDKRNTVMSVMEGFLEKK